ncbi:MAG: Ohr family peroxiredoxin [Hyphomonadaceae bacterium]|nr:Ohr family peroxiredoxin [Hyphomonadaceae bacterium]GIK48557.1 MAG: organic hydroperoxide resistance protein [Alphaproteobacteria bacterium]
MANPLFTTKAISKGGRAGGKVALADGGPWFHTEHDKALGGSGEGSNPEQFFALGYANCFNGAVLLVAKQRNVDASKATVTVEIGLSKDDTSFALSARIGLALPGASREQIQELLEAAHQVCPYSKATRGNIEVELAVEG